MLALVLTGEHHQATGPAGEDVPTTSHFSPDGTVLITTQNCTSHLAATPLHFCTERRLADGGQTLLEQVYCGPHAGGFASADCKALRILRRQPPLAAASTG